MTRFMWSSVSHSTRVHTPSPMEGLSVAPSSFRSQIQLLKLGFHRPIPCHQLPPISNFPFTPLSAGLNKGFRLRQRQRQRLTVVFASNADDPGARELKQQKSDAQGPPFLTILAGLLPFALVFWLLGSILAWLFGLIVKSPASK